MFHKALWLKDYKQSKFLLWAFAVVSLYVPFQLFQQAQGEAERYRYMREERPLEPFDFSFYPEFWTTAVVQMILIVVLAAALVGLERSNQHMEFSLSLPYSRKAMFLSKWFMGIVTIAVSLTISVLLSFWVFHTSILERFLNDYFLWYYYLTALVTFITVYTFSLAVGYLTGNTLSQLAFSGIFLFLPIGLYGLVRESIFFHWNVGYKESLHELFYGKINLIFELLTVPFYLLNIDNDIYSYFQGNADALPSLLYLLIPVAITVISMFIAIKLSERAKSEHNGMVLLYPQLQPYLKAGIIVCFFLLGGMFFGQTDHQSDPAQPLYFTYYTGGLAFAVIAYLIYSKVIDLKFGFGKMKKK
jgi:acetoin utilization transport system permease protein